MSDEQKPLRPTCKSCRYWEAGGVVNQGACKRYPPTALLASPTPRDIQQVNVFPVTMDKDWCGEHALKVTLQ